MRSRAQLAVGPDGRDMTATDSGHRVTVYWRPGCPYCRSLRRALRGSGLVYREVDIWDDRSGAAHVRSVAGGNETVPTVDVAGHALVNPRLKQVLAAVGEHAPDLLPASQPRKRWWRRA